MLHVGYEVFHPKPGQFETLSCRVCNTEMDVRRDCYGPTGFAEAMSGGGHLHDSFTCPHAEKDWHVKVLRIYMEAEKTNSDTLRGILEKDIADTIKTENK